MSKNLLFLFSALLLGSSLFAQDKADIIVKVTKDGKIVKDTTYRFDDLKKAKHAIHMIDAISSDDANIIMKKDVHMDVKTDGEHHTKKMIFISEDGDVKEITGDDKQEWISENGDHIVKMKKEIIIHGDADCKEETWTVEESEDGDVILINNGGEEIKMIKKIVEEGGDDHKVMKWVSEDDDDVEVIIIKTHSEDEDNIEVEVKVVEEKNTKKKKNNKKKK